MTTGYLTRLTNSEVRKIRYYAPRKTGLPKDKYQGIDLLNCKSVQDIYDIYKELDGDNKQSWRKHKLNADAWLLKEVSLLAKHLMEKMVNEDKEQDKELRDLIKIVIEYQEDLEEVVASNENIDYSYTTEGQGHLLFRGWTDDEIYHFWNGD